MARSGEARRGSRGLQRFGTEWLIMEPHGSQGLYRLGRVRRGADSLGLARQSRHGGFRIRMQRNRMVCQSWIVSAGIWCGSLWNGLAVMASLGTVQDCQRLVRRGVTSKERR